MFLYHVRRKGMDLSEGYIGVTSNFTERCKRHIWDTNKKGKSHYPLQQALKKFTDIEFVVIEEGEREYVLQREKELRPMHHMGWNTAAGGSLGGNVNSGTVRPDQREWAKKNGFKEGNKGKPTPIMAGGFIFPTKKLATEKLGVNAKTIFNRCRRGNDGYSFLRDSINDTI